MIYIAVPLNLESQILNFKPTTSGFSNDGPQGFECRKIIFNYLLKSINITLMGIIWSVTLIRVRNCRGQYWVNGKVV